MLRRGSGGIFLIETIRADFLIKRLNKKIGVNCLNKPLCDSRVPTRGTTARDCDDLFLHMNAHDDTQGQKGTH